MAGNGAKLRVAIGVFEDMANLNRAADALMELGLDPADLCFAIKGDKQPGEMGGPWVAVELISAAVWFQRADPSLPALPGGCFARKAASLIALAGGVPIVPRSHRSRSSDVWAAMNTHLAEGALLLFARLPSASVQDQAVRALLRYSRQPVHAEEFFTQTGPE